MTNEYNITIIITPFNSLLKKGKNTVSKPRGDLPTKINFVRGESSDVRSTLATPQNCASWKSGEKRKKTANKVYAQSNTFDINI